MRLGSIGGRLRMRHALGGLGLLALGVAACGSPAPLSGSPSTGRSLTPSATLSPNSASPSASQTASPAPSRWPSPAPAIAADQRWTRVADQSAFAAATMDAVVAGPDRFVAVGCAISAHLLVAPACTGVSWTSPDGRAWSRAAVSSADHLDLAGVVSVPTGYVAWAYDEPHHGAAVWASADGIAWRRAPAIPSFDFEGIDTVVWFGGQLYAKGSSEAQPFLAWTSPDGLAWSPVAISAGCGTSPSPSSVSLLGSISGIAAIGNHLVGWGTRYADGRYSRVTARSTDGACWGVTATTPSDGWVNAAIPTGTGLVGVGQLHAALDGGAGSAPPPIAAWTSVDGSSWVPATFSSARPLGGLDLVANLGRTFLALGTGPSGEMAWRSDNGTRWVQASSVPDAAADGAEVRGLVAGSGRLVAVGSTHGADGAYRAVVWIAP